LNYEYLASFYSQLSMIFKSGIPAAAGFLLLAEQEKDSGYRSLLNTLYQYIEQGMPVHRAMKETGVFSDYMVNMVELGEYTGKLDDVFSSLSDYCRWQYRIARAIREAFSYPLLLLVTMLAVFVIMITKVLPIFKDVLAQFGVVLTPMAAALLGFGETLKDNWQLILAVVAVLTVLAVLIAVIPFWRRRFSAFWGRILLHTGVGKKTLSARFSAAMSMIVSTGMDMEASVEMVEKFFTGFAGAERVAMCRKLVLEGGSLSEAVSEAKLLESTYAKILAVAIRTGKMDTAMVEIASQCEEDMYASLDRLTGRIEPVVVVLMAVMVGVVMLSVLLPLLDILSALG
jgi:type IV pilus assembly protein PilC